MKQMVYTILAVVLIGTGIVCWVNDSGYKLSYYLTAAGVVLLCATVSASKKR